jgi:tripartite-type tricarboxylate transporter receptor subunit TctC
MPRPTRRAFLGAAGLSPFAARLAHAADGDWPTRPIRLIVPFSAGGTVDVTARLAAVQLGRALGSPVVVDNLPGAGGVIASGRVATSPPDGYTLLFTTPNHTINPALFPRLPFDTEKDFAPVALVAEIPELLVASSGQPFRDFPGFVAYAKAHPGALDYGSAGNGTLPHVTMELLLQRLKIKVTHVPYKGAAPALNDLIAGQLAVKMDTIATASPHVRSGRLRALAIASARRSALMPDVPTIAELGLAGYEGILWMGILAPAGTPRAIVDRLSGAIARFQDDAAYMAQSRDAGVDPVRSDPAGFAKRIHAELGQWADVVRASHITVE